MIKKEKIKLNSRVVIYKIRKEDIVDPNDLEQVKKRAYFKSEKKNVICTIGLTCICAILSSHNDDLVDYDELRINNCALGDVAGHTEASTKLNAESYRKNISSCSYWGNALYTTSWYLPDDCSGNFREEGIFINGDVDTADSGYPLSLIDLTPSEGDKTTNDGLLIERKIIFD